MEKILLLTTNQKRAEKYKQKFAESNISVEFEILMEETPELQGESVGQVATNSALWGAKKYNIPCIKEDAAFEIPALNNFPTIYVKHVNIMLGAEGYVRLMQGVTDRRACWHNVLCYALPDGFTKTFDSVTWGTIAQEISEVEVPGPNWNVDKVWIPDGFTVPIAEIAKEDRAKRVWTHDKFNDFKEWFIAR